MGRDLEPLLDFYVSLKGRYLPPPAGTEAVLGCVIALD